MGPVANLPPREFGFDRPLFASGAIKIADDFDELPPELLKAFYGE